MNWAEDTAVQRAWGRMEPVLEEQWGGCVARLCGLRLPPSLVAVLQTEAFAFLCEKGRGSSPGLQDHSESITASVTGNHMAQVPEWLLHALS